jgi:hypothetical protein
LKNAQQNGQSHQKHEETYVISVFILTLSAEVDPQKIGNRFKG